MWKWINELDERDNCTVDDFDMLTDMLIETMNNCGYFSQDEIYDKRDSIRELDIDEKEYIVSKLGDVRIQVVRVA